jgi:hypothetical protein
VRTALLLGPGAVRSEQGPPCPLDRAHEELRDQLGRLGYEVVDLALPGEGDAFERFVRDLAAATGGATDLLLVDRRLVAHTAAIGAVAGDPRIERGVLIGSGAADPARAVQVDRGVAVGLSSPLHEPVTARAGSVGLCRLDAQAAGQLPEVVTALSARVGPAHLAEALRAAPVETLTAAAAAAGVRFNAVDRRGLVAERAEDGAQAAAALARREEVDEDRAWLDAAVKARDGWFTTFLVSPYTRFWARWAARRGLSPNQVSTASMLTGALAALLFAWGTRPSVVAGALALQLSFSLDCVDGQLSRYTQRFTAFGGWLDSTFDRAKEYLVYAGLAAWGARSGDATVWSLAACAVALQTVRHTVDLSFAVHRPPPVPARPRLRGAEEAAPPPGGHGGRVLAAASAAEERPLLKWGKRIVVFPIGERFAVISLLAIVGAPRAIFLVLLGWGAVAATYTLTGRLLRSRSWSGARLSWLRVPAARTTEYLVVLLAGLLVADAGPATYAAMAALVTRHYDEVYRERALGAAALRTFARTVLARWPIRAGVVVVAALAGVTEPVLWILAVGVGSVTLLDAVRTWQRAGTVGTHDAGDTHDEEEAE